MLNLFGTTISGRSIAFSLIHNAIEIVTMVGWLSFVLDGQIGIGTIILVIGLTVEHIFALAAGKLA